jgi:hypothetical protein
LTGLSIVSPQLHRAFVASRPRRPSYWEDFSDVPALTRLDRAGFTLIILILIPTLANFFKILVKSVKSVNCVNAIFLSLATFDLCAQPLGIHLLLQWNDVVELVRTRDRSAAFTPLHCPKRLAASGHQRVIHAEAA